MKYFLSFGVLGLLGLATANANTVNLNLNTGDGSDPYTITSDTLVPQEYYTVNVVTQQPGAWLNDLTSQWIAPWANQSYANTQNVSHAGAVTYQVQFNLPSNFSSPNLSITLEADDWATISINNNASLYTGPSTGQWGFDTVVPISQTFDNELVAGTNTLTFVVSNWGFGGPTGLDAQVNLAYTVPGGDGPLAPTPEPSTIVPLVGSVLLGGFALWRRRSMA